MLISIYILIYIIILTITSTTNAFQRINIKYINKNDKKFNNDYSKTKLMFSLADSPGTTTSPTFILTSVMVPSKGAVI